MRKSTVILGVIVALVVGAAPRAHAAPQGQGLALGLRGGFGLPQGLVEGGDGHRDVPLSEAVSVIIPVQLDVGYFVHSRVYVGASFQYAMGLLARNCSGALNCFASDLRFGANVSYHLPVSDTLSPWLGLGVGLDFFAPSKVPSVMDGHLQETDHVFKGLEFVNVQGGADLNVGGSARMGPFVTFTVSKYSNVNDDAFHSWLMGGLRLQVRL